MKIQITITPEGGWVAFAQSGNVVGSDDTVSTIAETVKTMGWIVVGHVSGIPDWSDEN